ncbi:MAG: hypothetical protein H6980_03385 [Gammaproteobacteria bacterium]|nr:hypothetical protein [Gammaproteobacteria bacterium]
MIPAIAPLALCAVLAASPCVDAVAGEAWSLTADAWRSPPAVGEVLAQPAVRAAVQAWLRQAGNADHPAALVITHPEAENGAAWANELRDWLIALAIPAEAIAIRSDDTRTNELRLFIESR